MAYKSTLKGGGVQMFGGKPTGKAFKQAKKLPTSEKWKDKTNIRAKQVCGWLNQYIQLLLQAMHFYDSVYPFILLHAKFQVEKQK